MKRFFYSSLSVALGMSIAAPGIAYFSVPGNANVTGSERESRRQVIRDAELDNRLSTFIPTADRSRGEAVENESAGYNLLRRADGRRFRRFNRTRKPGSDRYRTLNLRTNKRSLRGMEYESALPLPRTLVQTGGEAERPTRRAIRDNAYYTQVNDRNRDVLAEMRNSK